MKKGLQPPVMEVFRRQHPGNFFRQGEAHYGLSHTHSCAKKHMHIETYTCTQSCTYKTCAHAHTFEKLNCTWNLYQVFCFFIAFCTDIHKYSYFPNIIVSCTSNINLSFTVVTFRAICGESWALLSKELQDRGFHCQPRTLWRIIHSCQDMNQVFYSSWNFSPSPPSPPPPMQLQY